MKIALYGENFNPPHLGNVKTIKWLINSCAVDKVVALPNSVGLTNDFAYPTNEERLQMCNIAFEEIDEVVIEDFEIGNEDSCYLTSTIDSIKSNYIDSEVVLIDYGVTFQNPLHLEVIRVEEDFDNEYLLLREKLAERCGSDLLNDNVYSYIIKHRFYNSKPELRWLADKMIDYHKSSRIAHVLGCESEAISLARNYNENEDNAAEAGLLHDITKKLSIEEHLELCKKYGITLDDGILSNEKLLHSITGCALAKDIFGITDEIYNAIRWHTTGKPNMTLLEKIIYIADYIEPNRDFEGVDELRQLAYEDIDKCMALGLKMSIDDITNRGIVPYKDTKEAYDYYAET